MTLHDLQEHLRTHIRARIGRGELTGISLARAADFPQGHLSNFLNARRGLSLESMDRLLHTLGIGILDLMDKREIQQRAALPAGAGIERVAMVAAANAGLARFTRAQILETRGFNKSFLRKLKRGDAEDRHDWMRFVLIKHEATGVPPFAFRTASAVLLIDRHYSSLHPYRRLRPNVYLVRVEGKCWVGQVSVFDDYLLVQPRSLEQEVKVWRIEPGRNYRQYIVGRVCQVSLEI